MNPAPRPCSTTRSSPSAIDLTERRWTARQAARNWTFADLIEGNPFATCAGMMRTECVRCAPDWYADFFPITDWPLYLLCAMQGDLRFDDEISGVYRLHEGGEFSSQSTVEKHRAVESFYRRLARSAIRVSRRPPAAVARDISSTGPEPYPPRGRPAPCAFLLSTQPLRRGPRRTVAPREMLRLGAKLALRLGRATDPRSDLSLARCRAAGDKEGATRPRWSVMIPTYHCTRFLGGTLNSVLAQAQAPAHADRGRRRLLGR